MGEVFPVSFLAECQVHSKYSVYVICHFYYIIISSSNNSNSNKNEDYKLGSCKIINHQNIMCSIQYLLVRVYAGIIFVEFLVNLSKKSF